YIDYHLGPGTQKDIVLWDDILQAFDNALHIRHKSRVAPFFKGADLRFLEPHRIAVIPNTVSDVIVEDPLVSPGDSPLQATTPKTPGERSQETSQTTPQKSTQKTYHNKLAALKRNPVYGLEDETM
ncbi:hypothetical protein BGX29_004926, partial [Mortierella sp. GBA35]